MSRSLVILSLALALAVSIAGCQKDETPAPSSQGSPDASPSLQSQTPAPDAPATSKESPPYADSTGQPPPPTPPIKEDFEGEPKLSLFARVGDFAPEEDDTERLGYWVTFIDHLLRISGPIKIQDNRAFALRGIKTIDSIGFFSPIAVEPDREYRVSYRVWCKLPEKATTGVGYLEYNQFLWIGEQYSKSISEKYFRGAREGLRLRGKLEGKTQQFTFHSGPETRMVHLVFFLDGEADREPVIIDDIEIVPVVPR